MAVYGSWAADDGECTGGGRLTVFGGLAVLYAISHHWYYVRRLGLYGFVRLYKMRDNKLGLF